MLATVLDTSLIDERDLIEAERARVMMAVVVSIPRRPDSIKSLHVEGRRNADFPDSRLCYSTSKERISVSLAALSQ